MAKTQEELRKSARAGLSAAAKSLRKRGGLSVAARNARAAHSSAGKTKLKGVTDKVGPSEHRPVKKKKGGLRAWLDRKLGIGTRTAAIKRATGGRIKTDAERRVARKAK